MAHWGGGDVGGRAKIKDQINKEGIILESNIEMKMLRHVINKSTGYCLFLVLQNVEVILSE